MSNLSKKNSRKIVVDNVEYRWMISGRSRYLNNAPESLRLIVQKTGCTTGITSCTLISKINPHTDDNNPINKSTIFPKDVVTFIHKALEDGWNPEVTGDFVVSNIDLTEYKS